MKNKVKKIVEEYINEISPETFKGAIAQSTDRGTGERTNKLGELYLHGFIGMELFGGNIYDITTNVENDSLYIVVYVKRVENERMGRTNRITRIDSLYYVDNDEWEIRNDSLNTYGIERKDAVVLSKIAQKLNPDTKYKQTGRYFKIKNW